jgi:site-specific DNA-methyltransferase (adenine-specific)
MSKLINGDCLEELKKIDEGTVDLLCTDPPYGYGFMGKHWDKFEEKQSTKSQTVGWMSPGMKKSTYGMREFFVPIWKEALRVLKPGAFSFVMSAPRSDVQMVMLQTLQESGFDVSFTPIYWTYATGFPKAMNVGKKTEKENLEGSYAGYQPKPAVEVVIVAMKPLEKKGYTEQAKDNQKGVTWLDDARIPFAGMGDTEQYDKDNVGSQKNFDTEAEGLSRGNQPVRKTTKRKPREENTVFKTSGFKSEDNDTAEASPLGRFAANLLVSDNVLDTGKKTKSTGGRAYQNTNDMYSGGWAYDEEGTGENPGKGDEGDFSRYYSLDEWWKHRVSRLPEEVRNTFPFLVVPKASKSEKNMGLDDFEKQQKIYNGQSPESSKDMKGVEKKFTTQPSQNIHPTVKPIQLFSYLVTLGSRKDDVVLDPFMGSGTTPISCVTLDRKYLGIEREKEYFEIAEARVDRAKNPANLVEHNFWD